MALWIKNIGTANDPISNKWYDQGSESGEFRWHVRFSQQYNGAGIEKEDLLLYHAFVEGDEGGTRSHICGAARVSDEQAEPAPRGPTDQWPLVRRVTPLLVVPLARQGPTLKEIGVDQPPQGGYMEINERKFAKAICGLARNALPKHLHSLIPDS